MSEKITLIDPITGQPYRAGGGIQSTVALVPANSTLAGNANSTPVTIANSAVYGWSYTFGGTSPSLKLQTLGPDGTTWQDSATVTASGAQPVNVFSGSGGTTVRLLNATANSITGLSSQLAS